jgi:hypothetical protein
MTRILANGNSQDSRRHDHPHVRAAQMWAAPKPFAARRSITRNVVAERTMIPFMPVLFGNSNANVAMVKSAYHWH